MRSLKILLLSILCFTLFSACTKEEPPFQVAKYNCKTLVDYNEVFPDSIGTPIALSVNLKNNEFYVLNRDQRNFSRTVSVFNGEGEHVKMIKVLDIGKEAFFLNELHCGTGGEIVLVCVDSIKIFDKDGELTRSTNIESSVLYSSLNNNNEILMNSLKTAIITKYSLAGELLVEIGRIPEEELHVKEKLVLYWGNPFEAENGRYYLFQRFTGIVKIFNSEGELIENSRLAIPELGGLYSAFDTDIEERMQRSGASLIFFYNVVQRNDRFYILFSSVADDGFFKNIRDKEIFIYVLDTDLNIIRKIVLDDEDFVKEIFSSENNIANLSFMKFDVNEDEEIFIPFEPGRKILKFSPEGTQ
ncbi:hypothetical protein ACFL6G_00330 [candidate division KSB1 bacterium]